jgi:hypothetical protein
LFDFYHFVDGQLNHSQTRLQPCNYNKNGDISSKELRNLSRIAKKYKKARITTTHNNKTASYFELLILYNFNYCCSSCTFKGHTSAK